MHTGNASSQPPTSKNNVESLWPKQLEVGGRQVAISTLQKPGREGKSRTEPGRKFEESS